MSDFLKGNYQVPNLAGSDAEAGNHEKTRSLTEQMEESALAKLGGSMCFVIKGSQFVWSGDEVEETGE